MKRSKVHNRWNESTACVRWGLLGPFQEESEGHRDQISLFYCLGNVVLSWEVLLHFHKKKSLVPLKMIWHSFHNQLHLDFKMQLKCNYNVNRVSLKMFPKSLWLIQNGKRDQIVASLISHSRPHPTPWVYKWFIMWLVIITVDHPTDNVGLLSVIISMVDLNHNTVNEMYCVAIRY